jgi:hypothetical protein
VPLRREVQPAPVLEPIAARYGAELVLPTGEMSDALVRGIADRAAVDGRLLVVLYFADFDPLGWQMPVSVARKLQALGDLLPDLSPVQVHRVATTLPQVRALDLPSTLLKETERRADRWRARWGHEQTEIDALAQLRSAELQRIAVAAIRPFHDPTLGARAVAANAAWGSEAVRILEAAVGGGLDAKRAELATLLDRVKPELERLRREMAISLDSADLPPVLAVEPDPAGLPAPRPPLFDSTEDWAAATLQLASDRALADGGAA